LKAAGAGFIASILGFIALYLYFCVWTFATTGGGIAVTTLSAATTIPLMMILAVFLPNAFLGVLTGLALGAFSKMRGAVPRLPVGVLLGVVCAHLVFVDLFPRFFSSGPDANDLTRLLTPLPFVAVYGGLLGALVWKLYGKLSSKGSSLKPAE